MTRHPSAVRSTVRRRLPLATLVAPAACAPDRAPLAPVGTPLITSAEQTIEGGSRFVAGEVIERFREGTTDAGRGRVLERANGQVAGRIRTAGMRARGNAEGLDLLRAGMSVADAITELSADPDVEHAEPNWIYTHRTSSNDTFFTNGSL